MPVQGYRKNKPGKLNTLKKDNQGQVLQKCCAKHQGLSPFQDGITPV